MLCALAFVAYIHKRSVQGSDNNKDLNKIVNLSGARIGVGAYIGALNRGSNLSASDRDRLKQVVKPFFVKFDVDNKESDAFPSVCCWSDRSIRDRLCPVPSTFNEGCTC